MNTEKSKKFNKNIIILVSIIILGCFLLGNPLFIKILDNLGIKIYKYSEFSPNGNYKIYIKEIPTGAGSSFRFNICLQKNILNLGSIKLPIILHSKTLAAASPEIIVKWEDDEKFSLWEKYVGEGRVGIDYICEYTIDSFINSDTFINALNKEFREEMRKLKTVEDLTKEEMQKLKTVEELKYEEENSFGEENVIKY